MEGRVFFLMLFGISWAAMLGTTGKYYPFATERLFQSNSDMKCKAWKRLIIATFILDVLPIATLLLIYFHVVPKGTGPWDIASGAVASWTAFGFNRILAAFIGSESGRKHFLEPELCKVLDEASPKEPNTFIAHFVPGIIYLVLPVLIACFLGKLA